MKIIVAGALEECVHVAGLMKFLRLAKMTGWKTVFLGPAVSSDEILKTALREKAEMVCISYRLTPETGEKLLKEFVEKAANLHSKGVRFAFGGTPPIANRAKALGFFERIFEGGESEESILAYLKGVPDSSPVENNFPQNAIERIQRKTPYPIIRHHFGLPTVKSTIEGIKMIAESGVLDIVSLGTDQDAQEYFFKPDKQDPRRKGAGGVPVRSAEDYRALYAATRRGNFPMMRTYSGTDDFIRLAEMYKDAIKIAWGAIPIFWFNKMDGRGPWDLEPSITEHLKLIRWYSNHDIPVEINEPHHWGLRDAPDVISVTAAYLSAYIARDCGVQNYIAQLMFNTPSTISVPMDIAKMLAILEMIEPLTRPDFHIWRQTRTGLMSYPLNPEAARSHLAVSIYQQMALRPHIIHVVGHTEAQSAAEAKDVIEACTMAERAIEDALYGQPDMTKDPVIQKRKKELISESKVTLGAILSLSAPGTKNPLSDPETLAKAITIGILDAPHLKNNLFAKGKIETVTDERGACISADSTMKKPISEMDRIDKLEYFTR